MSNIIESVLNESLIFNVGIVVQQEELLRHSASNLGQIQISSVVLMEFAHSLCGSVGIYGAVVDYLPCLLAFSMLGLVSLKHRRLKGHY